MNKDKKAIVSFANHHGNYTKGIARLSESLRNNFDGDFLAFIGEASCGAPDHQLNPYAFKIHAIQKAIESGYEQILWLDSSVFAVGNVDGVFDDIEANGLVFQDAGHFLGTWSSDAQLKYFGISRDDAMKMRMIGNAGFLGININDHDGYDFFQQWKSAMQNDMFKGAWNNNDKTESQDERCQGCRHDMSCSSAIVHNMGLFHLAYKGDEVLQYAGVYDKVANETIVLKAQGI